VNAWKVILSTLVIFIAGVLTGGLVVSSALRIAQIRPRPANGPGGGGGPNAMAANPWQVRNVDLLRRMDRELELTPEQHANIEKIIAASQERTKVIWKPIAPVMNKEMQAVHAEIREELTPDQKKKFDGFAKPRPGQERRRSQTNSGPGRLNGTNWLDSDFTNAVPSKP